VETNDQKYADLRVNYGKDQLLETGLAENPFRQFDAWFDEAKAADIKEPNAMALATSHANQPSVRIVLLKGFSEEGLIFYTNYDSQKGQQLLANPKASVLFFWDILERQVRIEGKVEKTPESISDNYFYSRPKLSQIGAMVSPQSKQVANRAALDQEFEKAQMEDNIKRPVNWGGYLLVPERFEFWQGRPNRMHDRIVYEKQAQNWQVCRLAP
jgi:pyridoxamine 5'-phosphate oxidase